ncbi:hypothetical protein BKA63DRAFT_70899 [Paraphoma chrysanthemicola]|nr:hypothetical protein BKA63DRAFT_70899 [Paraphoma chrysanthemicola]
MVEAISVAFPPGYSATGGVLAFSDDDEAVVKLIETTSNGVGRRVNVTEDLVSSYIEDDYGQRALRDNGVAQAFASPVEESIKLFWSRRVGTYNGDMLPIPMNKELYTRLAPYARIPSVLPQILMNKTAIQICTEPQLPPHLCGMPRNTIRNEYLSFILQSIPGAMHHVCAGTSFTYHFPSRHMYIFMHGLASVNYDRFSYAIQNGAAKDSAFLIPSIMIQFRLERSSKLLDLWHDKVYWNERKLGIRFDHHDNPDPAGIDYTTLSKDVNAANTDLAYLNWTCKTIVRQLDFMDDIAHRFRSQAVKNGTSDDAAAHTEHLLLETHAHLRSWNTGLADRAEYLSKRGQALVQTVYSGIAQRDSAISLRLAATSTELAKTSHEVAISTSRDSAVYVPSTKFS